MHCDSNQRILNVHTGIHRHSTKLDRQENLYSEILALLEELAA